MSRLSWLFKQRHLGPCHHHGDDVIITVFVRVNTLNTHALLVLLPIPSHYITALYIAINFGLFICLLFGLAAYAIC